MQKCIQRTLFIVLLFFDEVLEIREPITLLSLHVAQFAFEVSFFDFVAFTASIAELRRADLNLCVDLLD